MVRSYLEWAMWCFIGALTIAIVAQTYVTRDIGGDNTAIRVSTEADGTLCVHVDSEEELRLVEMVLEAHRYRRENRVNDFGTVEKFANRVDSVSGY